jgi:hypothetical protein
MLDGFRQRFSERRSKYSLRKHIGRLRREGRLPQIGLAAVAVLTIGGLAFARCQGNSITGPSAPAAEDRAPGVMATVIENTMQRDAVFTGRNPCNGDLVVAKGKRHDKLSNTFSASGFTADHQINDSFKGVPLDAQGVEVTDPEFEYVGSDVHSDKMVVNFLDGTTTTHRELTNEHLSRRGGGDHWVLHVDQRMRFSGDPTNPTVDVEVKGHASCPDKTHCKLPDGCPDQAFTFVPPPPEGTP